MSDAPVEADETDPMGPSAPRPDAERVQRYLEYALLVGLALLAAVAAMQFYVNASAAVNRWVTSEYRSLFQALFNLVVLLAAGAVISLRVRRLGADG